MHNFRELKIWQRSMLLAELVYRAVKELPVEEKFGLSTQLKRCAVSIASNISEGAGRGTNNQFRKFLEFSMGSCNELQTQFELAKRLGYLDTKVADEIIEETLQVYRMILAFYNTLIKN